MSEGEADKEIKILAEDLDDFCYDILMDLINLRAIDSDKPVEEILRLTAWMKKGILIRQGNIDFHLLK